MSEYGDVDWLLVASVAAIVIGTAAACMVFFTMSSSEAFDALLWALKIGTCLFAFFAISYTIWQIFFDKENVNL